MATFGRISYIWGVFTLLALLCDPKGPHLRGFVTIKNTHFVVNGSPFLFNGFNSYWMMHVASDPNERHKITDVFREAVTAGLTVCRTWAVSDGGDPALQMSPGVHDEHIFQALDFVILEARKYGIGLILSFVNNFNDYGGRPQYVQWAKNAGAPINGDNDFYTNPMVKNYYKNHVKRLLTRFNTITRTLYKDDPTIMAWELMNEPRCQVAYSGRTVHEWVEEMAKYTKSLDRKHLLEIRMEGFYGDSMPEKKINNPGYQVGTDFIRSNLIRVIDFATIHVYPDIRLSGQSNGSQLAFIQRWMASHWRDSKSILKKPLLSAEFVKSKKDPSFTINGRNAFLSIIYQNIYNFARNRGTIAGGLVWQIMAEGMDPYYDGYEIVPSRDTDTNAVITRQSHKMSALAHIVSGPHNHMWTRPHGVKHGHEVSKTHGHTLSRPHDHALHGPHHHLLGGPHGHSSRRLHGGTHGHSLRRHHKVRRVLGFRV